MLISFVLKIRQNVCSLNRSSFVADTVSVKDRNFSQIADGLWFRANGHLLSINGQVEAQFTWMGFPSLVTTHGSGGRRIIYYMPTQAYQFGPKPDQYSLALISWHWRPIFIIWAHLHNTVPSITIVRVSHAQRIIFEPDRVCTLNQKIYIIGPLTWQ